MSPVPAAWKTTQQARLVADSGRSCSAAPGQQGRHQQADPTHDQAQEAQPALNAVGHRLGLHEASKYGGGLLRQLGSVNTSLAIVVCNPGGGLLHFRAVLAQIHPLSIRGSISP